MSKKHDENKDLRSFSRIGKIDYSDHSLQTSKNTVIGIRMWGKIDYLTHYCGWHFYWNNNVQITKQLNNDENKSSQREIKKAKKEHQLSNKNKRSTKKV